MTEEIIIQGNSVELRDVSVIKTVPLADFKEAFTVSAGVQTPIIPQQAILYKAHGEMKWFLTERKPAKQKIKYRHREGAIKEYELAMPWVYLLMEFSRAAFNTLYIYFSPKKIESAEDMLYHAPLTNLNSKEGVCLGDGLQFSVDGTMRNKISQLEIYFFDSIFNDDLSGQHVSKMPTEILGPRKDKETRYEAWHRLTAEGLEACSLSWHPYLSLQKHFGRIGR